MSMSGKASRVGLGPSLVLVALSLASSAQSAAVSQPEAGALPALPPLPSASASAGGARDSRHISGPDDPAIDPLLEADDPDFSGLVDFSNAVPGPGGSWCITKTKFIEHLVKDQIKECWHQNVTQCHDTYVTEFLPSQEQKCEETFWKSCKIDFREMPYNYTLKQCHTPLVKVCDPAPSSGYGAPAPEIVCKTWFESECNTTYTQTTPNVEDKPNTWCKKVPRKICAPDHCRMVAGEEECSDKMLVSTVQKPTELCDLQPQQHCRLITKLTPHLISKEVCRDIPKEMCHLALSAPKTVRKPITLKWCTKKKDGHVHEQPQPEYQQQQPYKAYLPPPPAQQPQASPAPFRTQQPPAPLPSPNSFSPPSRKTFPSPPVFNSAPGSVPNFQRRSDHAQAASAPQASRVAAPEVHNAIQRFPPPPSKKKHHEPHEHIHSLEHHPPAPLTEAPSKESVTKLPPPPPPPAATPSVIAVTPKRKVFGPGLARDAFRAPVFQEQFLPAASEIQSHSVQVPMAFDAAANSQGNVDKILEQLEKQLAEEEELDEEEELEARSAVPVPAPLAPAAPVSSLHSITDDLMSAPGGETTGFGVFMGAS